jgi:hypothetical protein
MVARMSLQATDFIAIGAIYGGLAAVLTFDWLWGRRHR